VIVTFGHGMEHEVWDMQQMAFRLAMIMTLLLLPPEWDVLRFDALLRSRKASAAT